ncbi:MAG: carboxymuconolactone decarboxylase family protein [Nitrospiraceae bacterium]|nr:MAG: carboxymuconolactone decarboxylase family protein [Nitrospiraceae bacterium]
MRANDIFYQIQFHELRTTTPQEKKCMQRRNKKTDMKQVRSLMKSNDLAESLSAMIEKNRGELGFLLSILKKRPSTFNPYVLKGMSIYSEPAALDKKTAELVAVGAAAALRCEHCIQAHVNRAASEGAGPDEILDAILIAGAISESSTLSVAFRKFRQHEGSATKKADRQNKK